MATTVKKILEASTIATPVPGMPGCFTVAPQILLNHFAGAASEKWTIGMVSVFGEYAGMVYIKEMNKWQNAGDFDISSG